MESVRNFLMLGLGPLIGGLMLFGIGVKAAFYYSEAENVSSKPILGITLPLWMGIGGMVLGAIVMILSRPFFKEFFSRKTETAPPGLLEQPPPTGPVPARVEF
jgi:ABC-type phosphate transport system permease subunit